jgi:hypothetical protein
MLKIKYFKRCFTFLNKKKLLFMEKNIFENFNISRNNIFSVEAAKVL